MNQPLSGIHQARSAIIHRNVRCAPDMSGEPSEQRSLRVNGRLQKGTMMNSATQKSERRSQRSPDMSRVAPDRPVQLQDNGSNGQIAPNPNGHADVAHTRH
jgi:hypothetical protein